MKRCSRRTRRLCLLLLAILPLSQVQPKLCNDQSGQDPQTLGLPDLACCGISLPVAEQDLKCLYTSACNLHGTCCQSPSLHSEYQSASRMGQTGHCCEHAEDCASGICIGGACWSKQDSELAQYAHNQKQQLVIAAIVALLVLICIISFCCMHGLKMRTQLVDREIGNKLINFAQVGLGTSNFC